MGMAIKHGCEMTFRKGSDPNRNLSGRPSLSVENKAKGKPAASYQNVIQQFRTHEDMKTFQIGLLDYDNLDLHSRYYMHRVFRNVLQDPHLTSQWNTRLNKTLEKQFKLVSIVTGDEVPEKTALLQAQWFRDYVCAILNSYMWGFTLMEFGPVDDNKFMPYINPATNKLCPAVNELDRDYVKPEFGLIVHNYGDITGLSFDDPKYADQLLFVGKYHDAGILYNACKYILFKDNALANWSEFAEVFGMPVRVGKTAGEDSDRARLLQAMKAMGSNGYGVIDIDDVIEYISQDRTDAFNVYDKLIAYLDSQVSKLVFGQDVISNNTGHVIGKTGENVSNLYGTADADLVKLITNDFGLGKFQILGIGDFTGLRFEWDVSEKVALKDKSLMDLQLSQASGKKVDPVYIEETYGTILSDEDLNPMTPEKDPEMEKTKQKTKNFYDRK